MNEQQRSAQIRAIVIEYKRQVSEGILQPLHVDPNESRYLWAYRVLGRIIPSFNVLTDWELNILRDTLNGKACKLLSRAKEEFERCGIQYPDRWIARCAQSDSFRAWRGKTLETLPAPQLYRLVKILERRGSARNISERSAPQPRHSSNVRLSEEQQMLW
jgi:hypothetical protein